MVQESWKIQMTGSVFERIGKTRLTAPPNTLRWLPVKRDPKIATMYSNLGNHGILVTGVAGLLAGACSMALGDWVPVTSSRELAEREIRIESSELAEDPKGEGEELQLIYEAKGLSVAEAKRAVAQLLQDQVATLDALAREELRLDPQELGGSAREAAVASFFLFALGAIIPILPSMLARASAAILASLALSGIALLAIGAVITIFTGVPVWRSGGRQFLLGLGAAGVTFAIGRLIGVTIA
jgi:vacuolar iron transporter family protein